MFCILRGKERLLAVYTLSHTDLILYCYIILTLSLHFSQKYALSPSSISPLTNCSRESSNFKFFTVTCKEWKASSLSYLATRQGGELQCGQLVNELFECYLPVPNLANHRAVSSVLISCNIKSLTRWGWIKKLQYLQRKPHQSYLVFTRVPYPGRIGICRCSFFVLRYGNDILLHPFSMLWRHVGLIWSCYGYFGPTHQNTNQGSTKQVCQSEPKRKYLASKLLSERASFRMVGSPRGEREIEQRGRETLLH